MKDNTKTTVMIKMACSPLRRSTVKLMIRKVQFAPEGEGISPSVETTRDFVMSDKPLYVKASLDKEASVRAIL